MELTGAVLLRRPRARWMAGPTPVGVELANEGRVHEHLYHIGRGVVVGITKRRAWMMVFTVVACTAVFIAEMAVNDCPGHQCSSNLQVRRGIHACCHGSCWWWSGWRVVALTTWAQLNSAGNLMRL
eukprot:scaffold1890_cov380-Prasinococcus_capsulatus_cf.AAC.11